MNRREFLQAGGGLLGAALFPAEALSQTEPPRLRTITYNVLACRGYPETDANRDMLRRARQQMVERFALELALYEPDIVTFQESPGEATVAAIAGAMGQAHTYFPGGFPGAVITRHKIIESENCPLVEGSRPADLFTRHWGRAVIEIGGQRLSLYSAHLHPSDAAVRAREVTVALEVMAKEKATGVPVLFQGDLNHEPDGPEYERWRVAGWVDVVRRVGHPSEFTFPSTTPAKSIDYIWTNNRLTGVPGATRVLFEGGFRTNPADPRSFALSDHLPVMAELEWA